MTFPRTPDDFGSFFAPKYRRRGGIAELVFSFAALNQLAQHQMLRRFPKSLFRTSSILRISQLYRIRPSYQTAKLQVEMLAEVMREVQRWLRQFC